MSDPFEPWGGESDERLLAVFELGTVELQVRALLDLNPKVSAKQIAALPWEQKEPIAFFKRIRDAWAAERAIAREQERAQEEKPLEDDLWTRVRASIQSGDLKSAKEAFELMSKVATSKQARAAAAKGDDDFSRLTDVETLVLGALCHKLRDEPLTEFDEGALQFIASLRA